MRRVQRLTAKRARLPDGAGWWYDVKCNVWRWVFHDPGMGLCAAYQQGAGHYWPVLNYKPEDARWSGPYRI